MDVKFLSVKELEVLSPDELLKYKKDLEKYKKYLVETCKMYEYVYELTIKELKERVFALEYSCAETEIDRLEASTVQDFASLFVH